jgi:O-acetyl-ADP-ribose deacetylase (regulator of RNase III)
MLGLRHHRGVAIDLFQGDITAFACDAMVNAANESLLGGAGVDGAIHRAGGPEILAACRTLGGCPTGGAVATTAGRLPARYVIHAVGPVYRGGGAGEGDLLRSAYAKSLAVAAGLGIRHVSFPAISTGAYGYPVAPAAEIALGAVKAFAEGPVEERGAVGRVTFVLFSLPHYHVFQETLFRLFPEDDESSRPSG